MKFENVVKKKKVEEELNQQKKHNKRLESRVSEIDRKKKSADDKLIKFDEIEAEILSFQDAVGKLMIKRKNLKRRF